MVQKRMTEREARVQVELIERRARGLSASAFYDDHYDAWGVRVLDQRGRIFNLWDYRDVSDLLSGQL